MGDFDFAAALCAAAHGDASRPFFRPSTDDFSSIASSLELKEGGTGPYSLRSFILYRFYIAWTIIIDRNRVRFQVAPTADTRDIPPGPLVAPPGT